MKKQILYCLLLVSLCSCQRRSEVITFGSLLQELITPETLAQYPKPYYTTRQFSSYDRKSVCADSLSWYANCDRSQFLRIDSMNRRREFVMADVDGPGVITRFWVTVADYSGQGILRIYLDNQDEPIVVGEVLKVISGQALVSAPLSTSVSPKTEYKQRGHNLYLPIPYAKHCRITYESPSIKEPGECSGECFYYNINYRTYEKNTKVQTFTLDDLKTHRNLLEKVQLQLKSSRKNTKVWKKTFSHYQRLASRQENVVSLSGSGAVQRLDVKLNADDFNQALRSTILRISFDEHETVWVPVGDFFGSGNRLSPFQTYYTEVTNDSLFSCFWIMPYQDTCNITLQNMGKQNVETSLTVYTAPWEWNSQSMYFGAGWTEYNRLHTRTNLKNVTTEDHFERNFVQLTGKGVYVGDGITLFNSLPDWWGEGDEKIYVDGETFPSHFGTGTEDYYGYAWCMHNEFSHPFIAEPDGTGSTQCGHVSNVRYRGLDAIPFTQSLKFDMEIWHWGSTVMNYAPTTFWYMLPGGVSNRHPEPEKAALNIAKHKNDLVSNVAIPGKKVEGEFLDIQLKGGIEKSQSIPTMNWSNGAQFFWADAKPGDEALLNFKVEKAGNYQLNIAFSMAPDYGCVDIYLNHYLWKKDVNLYNNTLVTRNFNLGNAFFQEGINTLKIVQNKPDKRAVKSLLGVDYIMLKKINV